MDGLARKDALWGETEEEGGAMENGQ